MGSGSHSQQTHSRTHLEKADHIMKVLIGPPWVEKIKGLPTWFTYGKYGSDKLPEVDLTWSMLQELYNSGCNVMLFHDGSETILFVDSRCFTQR